MALPGGKTIEADFIFMGLGNKSNANFVEKADGGAVVDGLVRVDEYLKVSFMCHCPALQVLTNRSNHPIPIPL